VPRLALRRRPVAASKRASVLPALVAAAIVLIASLPATRTWSQQRPRGTEQRLLFEPSALDARPGVFRSRSGSQPAGPAKPADDEARKASEPRSFAPLQSNGALVLPNAPRATNKFGVAAGDGPAQTRLGLETEHKFRPDELPSGEKTHGLSYQRELHVKPFLGLSLTSPIE
jgi:hypothetical protein